MADFDATKFGQWLRANVADPQTHPFGNGQCALNVRQALAAGGLVPAVHPVEAKDWGPTLLTLGLAALPQAGYAPAAGDVCVIQPTSVCPDGHIEGYDGQNWISDFVQREFWPGPSFRIELPAYVIYRWFAAGGGGR